MESVTAFEQERLRHDTEASVLRGQLEALRGELQNVKETLEQQVAGMLYVDYDSSSLYFSLHGLNCAFIRLFLFPPF
jgi:hypothetical protein